MSPHWRLCDFAVSNLLRNRARTAVVLVVYSLLVALVASLLLFVRALRSEARLLLREAPEVVVQRLVGGRHEPIPVARAAAVEGLRGVRSVAPRVWGYSYDPPTGMTLTLWGADSVPAGTLDLRTGTLPESEGLCVVGQGVADARFLGTGDRLPLKGADGRLVAPRVTGIFRADSSVLTNDLVVLPTAELRRLFSLADEEATDLAVTVANPFEVDTVARKIQELWPDVRVITRAQILSTYDAVFDWRGGLWAALLLSSVAAFAILVWNQATGLSAEEYRTIGLLKAVGWSSRDILELRLWEGAIVSSVAVATGVILAQVHLVWLDGALFARILQGWSVTFPPLEMRPGLDAYTALVCLPLAVLPYVAASLVPAWRAAITDPDTILRS